MKNIESSVILVEVFADACFYLKVYSIYPPCLSKIRQLAEIGAQTARDGIAFCGSDKTSETKREHSSGAIAQSRLCGLADHAVVAQLVEQLHGKE